MKTKTVTHEQDGFKASVTVSEADTEIGWRRTWLEGKARHEYKAILNKEDAPPPDESYWSMRVQLYPRLIAPVVAIDINGNTDLPTIDELKKFPEVFTIEWEAAVYDLNEHWWPGKREDEKKAPTTSISG